MSGLQECAPVVVLHFFPFVFLDVNDEEVWVGKVLQGGGWFGFGGLLL